MRVSLGFFSGILSVAIFCSCESENDDSKKAETGFIPSRVCY